MDGDNSEFGGYMKVIFLDFDGVWVNTLGTQLSRTIVDAQAVELISRIVSEQQVKIVVSSTWRLDEDRLRLHTYLNLGGFGDSAALHDDFKTLRVRSGFRGDEIDEWLSRHPEVTRYAIIDDDSDFHEHHLNHFVHVDYRVGFSAVDYMKTLTALDHNKDLDMIRPFGPRDFTKTLETYRDLYDSKNI